MKWIVILLLLPGIHGSAQNYPKDPYTLNEVFKENLRCSPDSNTAHWYNEYRLIIDSANADIDRKHEVFDRRMAVSKLKIDRDYQNNVLLTGSAEALESWKSRSYNLGRLVLIMMISRYQWKPGLFVYQPPAY